MPSLITRGLRACTASAMPSKPLQSSSSSSFTASSVDDVLGCTDRDSASVSTTTTCSTIFCLSWEPTARSGRGGGGKRPKADGDTFAFNGAVFVALGEGVAGPSANLVPKATAAGLSAAEVASTSAGASLSSLAEHGMSD